MFDSVFKILGKIAATSSKNEKLAIMQSYAGHDQLKRVCVAAYNPRINYFMRKVPSYTMVSWSLKLSDGLEVLEQLSRREATGHAAQALAANTLANMDEPDANVLQRVLLRDLRCGMSEGTINKTWPKLIPEWPCMLATTADEKILSKFKWPGYCQLKLDGMRFNAIVRADGSVEMFSRNGNQLDLLNMLDVDFLRLAGTDRLYSDVVFDGELWIDDGDGRPLPRKTGNGILSKAIKGTISPAEAEMVRATIWDQIDLKGFEAEYYNISYKNRLAQLYDCFRYYNGSNLYQIENNEVETIEEVNTLYAAAQGRGEEGVMLKDPKQPWEAKRTKHQIKFKNEASCDLLCIGWEYGSKNTKNEHRLGALVLESAPGKDGSKLLVKVGSGFTDADRDELTAENTVGKVVTINYNCRILDKKTKVDSLFLPVFVEVREDKSSTDTNDSIK